MPNGALWPWWALTGSAHHCQAFLYRNILTYARKAVHCRPQKSALIRPLFLVLAHQSYRAIDAPNSAHKNNWSRHRKHGDHHGVVQGTVVGNCKPYAIAPDEKAQSANNSQPACEVSWRHRSTPWLRWFDCGNETEDQDYPKCLSSMQVVSADF